MQFLLFVVLLATFLLGCASVPSNSRIRNLPLGDQEIRAGNGAFVLRDVKLDGDILPGSWIVKGFIENNTRQDWKRIQFYFQLYNVHGFNLERKINSDITFIADSLNDGNVQPFTTNYFKTLVEPDSIQWVGKYIVTYQGTTTGKYRFVMTKPWESRDLLFEDRSIRVAFSISEKQVGLILQNKMYSPIKVDWNNISYVDIVGSAHGVMHTGVRYMERDRPQVPTVIPPAARIEDVIVPSDHILYTPGSGSGWSSRYLFPSITETDLYIGKSFSVFMPLEFGGDVKNYLFSFRIEREVTYWSEH